MKIGLLTQWYDPEPGPAALPGVLARRLRDRGHEVRVLTGFPNYPTGKISSGYRVRRRSNELMDGIAVRRVANYPSHDSSVPRRLASYASFSLSAVVSGLDALSDVDVLWVNYSPVTVGLPMWFLRYGRRIPCVLHVSDLWPDTVTASGFAIGRNAYHLAESTMSFWCGGMYASAHSIAVISPGVRRVLAARGVNPDKVAYAPMWANEALFYPTNETLRDEYGLRPEQTVLLYAGSIGGAQGLKTLIDACALVQDTDLVCLIAGSGVSEEGLRQHAGSIGARNVRFLGRVPSSRMTRLMATGDLHYIGLRSDPLSGLTMPSKLQATLAAGRPIVASVEGDAAEVIHDSGSGWVVPAGNATALADSLRMACNVGREGLDKIGLRGREYYQRVFAARHGVDRVEQLLVDAASSGRGRNGD